MTLANRLLRPLFSPVRATPGTAVPLPRLSPLLGTIAALAILLPGCSPRASEPLPGQSAATATPADVVLAWNARVLALAEAEDRFLTLKGVRATAMTHLAMHDALAAIEPIYRPYALTPHDDGGHGLSRPDPASEADPITAANAAAFAVAVSQYPDRRATLEAERARWARAAGHAAVEASRQLGERAAAAVLEARRDDGWDADAAYEWRPAAPGVYAGFPEHSGTPEGYVFGPGWARARPFVMTSPDQFRSPPPPAIESEAYARAFDEVKELGRRDSRRRAADQTHLAMWWKEFVEKSHNRLARQLVVEEGLGLWPAARLFALLNTSIYDGYVASFDSKFFYNHWRPYTAIRRAGTDGNALTRADTSWTNLHDHTYAFPSYPSAHGAVCGAAMTVLASVFGDDRPVVMTIPEVDAAGPMSPKIPTDPPTRAFASFDAAARECSLSRVYLGIHFRYDSEAGTEMGKKVGRLAVRTLLPPR